MTTSTQETVGRPASPPSARLIGSASLQERLAQALAEIERLKPLAEWAEREKQKRAARVKWRGTPEQEREYSRRSRERHREARRLRDRQYRLKNLAKVKMKDQRYRARKKQETLELGLYDLKSKLG